MIRSTPTPGGGQLASVAPTAPVVLTADEIAMLSSFRSMDDRSRAYIVRITVSQAERCPRRHRPTFRLIDGGAK